MPLVYILSSRLLADHTSTYEEENVRNSVGYSYTSVLTNQ